MTLYEHNLTLLKQNAPDWARWISEIPPEPDIEVIKSRVGDPVIKIKDSQGRPLLLHSSYDPKKEAARLLSSFDPQHPWWIVLGFGAGYHVLELIEKLSPARPARPGVGMIIIEKNPAIFKTALKVLDFSSLLTLKNIKLIIGQEPSAAIKILQAQVWADFSVLKHPSSLKLYPHYYGAINEAISALISQSREIDKIQLNHWKKVAVKEGLRAVLDPADEGGWKNLSIDFIHKKALARYLYLNEDERILDFGCGTGRVTFWVAREPVFVVGVDPVREMLLAALKTNEGRFIQADGLSLPFRAASFDVVLCSYVLAHLVGRAGLAGRDFQKAVKEIQRVLKDRGKLYLIEKIGSGYLEQGANGYISQQRQTRDYLEAFADMESEICCPIRKSNQVVTTGQIQAFKSQHPEVDPCQVIAQWAKEIFLTNKGKPVEADQYVDHLFVFSKSSPGRTIELETDILTSLSSDDEEILSQSKGVTFFSSNEWLRIIEKTYSNYKGLWLRFRLSNGKVVYLPGLRRGDWLDSLFAGTYGGFVSTNPITDQEMEAILAAISGIFQQLRIEGVNISPNPLSPASLPLFYREAKLYTHILSLDKDFDEICKSDFGYRARRHTKKAERCGVKVCVDSSPNGFTDYYRMYLDSAGRWGKKNPYPFELFMNLALVNSEKIKLWLAEIEGKRVAGILLFYGGEQVIYWSGAFYKDYAWCCPNHFLFKASIQDACQQGYRYFNFGSSLAGGQELTGVRKFKEQFGPQQVDYYCYQIKANEI